MKVLNELFFLVTKVAIESFFVWKNHARCREKFISNTYNLLTNVDREKSAQISLNEIIFSENWGKKMIEIEK